MADRGGLVTGTRHMKPTPQWCPRPRRHSRFRSRIRGGEVLVGDRYGRFEYRNLNRAAGEDLPRVRAAAALVGSLPAR